MINESGFNQWLKGGSITDKSRRFKVLLSNCFQASMAFCSSPLSSPIHKPPRSDLHRSLTHKISSLSPSLMQREWLQSEMTFNAHLAAVAPGTESMAGNQTWGIGGLGSYKLYLSTMSQVEEQYPLPLVLRNLGQVRAPNKETNLKRLCIMHAQTESKAM